MRPNSDSWYWWNYDSISGINHKRKHNDDFPVNSPKHFQILKLYWLHTGMGNGNMMREFVINRKKNIACYSHRWSSEWITHRLYITTLLIGRCQMNSQICFFLCVINCMLLLTTTHTRHKTAEFFDASFKTIRLMCLLASLCFAFFCIGEANAMFCMPFNSFTTTLLISSLPSSSSSQTHNSLRVILGNLRTTTAKIKQTRKNYFSYARFHLYFSVLYKNRFDTNTNNLNS